jgi:hypothetical protein
MRPLQKNHFLALVALATSAATAHANTLTNGTLTIGLATSTTYTTANADRVDAIQWVGSSTVFTNYVANGGPLHCNDPQEFFGQAYGDSGLEPYAVITGTQSKWKAKNALAGKTTVTSTTSCEFTLDALATTAYALSNKPGLRNTLKITRTFKFKTPDAAGNLRAYVPRLPITPYTTVYAPDQNGIVQTYNAGGCAGACMLTDWNGTWFADDDGAGNGMVVLRSPTKNKPAFVYIDNDSFSASNNTGVTLAKPQSGWTGTYTETEYLCFYDATSWPASARNGGKLPTGCTSVSIK